MITNALLKEKWKTQEKMAKEAGYDITVFLDNSEKTVEEMAKQYGLKLRFSKIPNLPSRHTTS